MMGTLRAIAKEQPMADEQDRPDEPSEQTPPAKHSPANAAKKAAKKAPAKKAPAKGTKATPKKAAKKAPPPPPPKPAQPAPPPEPAPPPPPPEPPVAAEPTLADTNGETAFGSADDTAARARQAVDTAGDSLGTAITRVPGSGRASSDRCRGRDGPAGPPGDPPPALRRLTRHPALPTDVGAQLRTRHHRGGGRPRRFWA